MTNIAKKPYSFVIFQGRGSGSPVAPLDPRKAYFKRTTSQNKQEFSSVLFCLRCLSKKTIKIVSSCPSVCSSTCIHNQWVLCAHNPSFSFCRAFGIIASALYIVCECICCKLWKAVLSSWVNVFGIIPEFRILRLTFHRIQNFEADFP